MEELATPKARSAKVKTKINGITPKARQKDSELVEEMPSLAASTSASPRRKKGKKPEDVTSNQKEINTYQNEKKKIKKETEFSSKNKEVKQDTIHQSKEAGVIHTPSKIEVASPALDSVHTENLVSAQPGSRSKNRSSASVAPAPELLPPGSSDEPTNDLNKVSFLELH